MDEVVVTAPNKFSDRVGLFGIIGAEHLRDPSQYAIWETSFKGDLDDYNRQFNTNYVSEREVYADWNLTFNYMVPQREHIMSIHAATAEAAEYVSYILPTPSLGATAVFKGVPAFGRAFSFGSKYIDDTAIKASVYDDDLIHAGKRIGIDKIYSGYNALSSSARRILYPVQKALLKERSIFRNVITTQNVEFLLGSKKYRGGI